MKKSNLQQEKKWYNYKPAKFLKSEIWKILWADSLQRVKKLKYNKPGILVEDKIEKEWLIIDQRQ